MAATDALVRRWCREGDEEAFAAFYRAEAPRLWKLLVARGADPETAYDLLAEAFLRLTRTACRDPSAPRALLYRIALNLLVDHQRRQATARRLAPDPPEAATGGDPAEHETLRRLVRERLDGDEQDIVLMRYWIGMTHREIAAALGLPEGTVRRKAAEALARLRAAWRECGP